MTEITLSQTQVEDGIAEYLGAVDSVDKALWTPEPEPTEILVLPGDETIKRIETPTNSEDADKVPTPTYLEAQRVLGSDNPVGFEVERNQRGALSKLKGLRVTVGVNVPTRSGKQDTMYFPGIVVPDDSEGVQIGFLAAGPDLVTPDKLQHHLSRPLSDMQFRFLVELAAKHARPNVHKAGVQHNIDLVDIGEAIVVASQPPTKIHNRAEVFGQKGLAESVANTGASDIRSKHQDKVRKNRSRVHMAASFPEVHVAEIHQPPATHKLSATELAIGGTLAAVRSQGEHYPQPNIKVNAENLITGQ